MHVLIIDDDEDVQSLLRTYLESEGFSVYSAHTGLEGLQAIGQRNLNLVLLDILLPDLNGWEVCQRIRLLSGIPIVMISAAAREARDLVHGLAIGADDYVTKPIDFDVLRARIKALLRRSPRQAWQQVAQSHADIHPSAVQHHKLEMKHPLLSQLTDREHQVLNLMACGWNNNDIATELNLAEQTVRNYVSIIYHKLAVDSRAEAIVWARKHGLGGE